MKTIRILGAAAMAGSALLAACAVETGDTEEAVGRSEAAVIGVDTFLYFRSNATGWGVDDSTRLVTNLGGAFFKTVDVTEPWMVSGFDTATVTETNQLNGWGSSQTFYDLANTQTLVAGTTQALAVSPPGGDPHFQVDYALTGRHQLLVNTSVTPFTIGIRSEADVCASVGCPAGTHCELASNGLPTCVGDAPVCGGVQCAPFSICCNAGCANAFCFGGSGACPPVPCE